MVSRCDYYSDEEYEYAIQMEIEDYREQLAYEEAFAKYCEEEYMKEEVLKRIVDEIKNYLQNDCADEWHVELKIEENSIVGYYTNIKEFVLTYDEDFEDWYIGGEYLCADMISGINKILQKYNN